jgi:hypothetical protein
MRLGELSVAHRFLIQKFAINSFIQQVEAPASKGTVVTGLSVSGERSNDTLRVELIEVKYDY